VADV
jgi:hypothetical protein